MRGNGELEGPRYAISVEGDDQKEVVAGKKDLLYKMQAKRGMSAAWS
jgi:hypothetical protein